jgi:DNA-binding MarR family transcriptional regulator
VKRLAIADVIGDWAAAAEKSRADLISIMPGRTDRRSKELRLTDAGIERLRAAREGWREAQTRFAAAFGEERTARLRALLREVAVTDLPAASDANA